MKNTAFLLVAIASFLNVPIMALTQYNDGGTYNIVTTVNDDIWADYEIPSMYTTINILAGGAIPAPFKLHGYNDSNLNISGGSVYGLEAYDNTLVTISDGSMGSSLYAYDNSLVTITGGWANSSNSYGNSQISLLDGATNYLYAYENGKIIMSGGSVNTNLSARDSSQIEISDGSVNSGLQAINNGQVTMSGGTVGYLYATTNGQISMSGGSVEGNLNAYDSTQATWSGGTIGGNLRVTDNANLLIKGDNFAIDGNPCSSGTITSFFGGSYLDEPHRQLTGILAYGGMLDNSFVIGNSASITLEIVEITPYVLTIESIPPEANSITPSVGQHNCGELQVVNISAEQSISCPDVYKFKHWDGDVADPNSASTTVVMDSDKTVTAVFNATRECGDECHDDNLFGDYDHNCIIDITDFAQFALNWMKCTKPECD
jgi:hypothetical protein